MRRSDPLMMLADRDRLGRLKEAASTIGEFLKVHHIPLWLGADMVWPLDHTRAIRQRCGGWVSLVGGMVRTGP